MDHPERLIRDPKDQPILNASIMADVDMIITGDKDFLCMDIESPRRITAAKSLFYIVTDKVGIITI